MSKKVSSKVISDQMLGAITAIIAIILVFAIVLSAFLIIVRPFSDSPNLGGGKKDSDDYPFYQKINVAKPTYADNGATIDADSINSERAIVYNVTDGKIIASRQCEQIMYPASMTKVMTLIVVYENLKSESELNTVLTVSKELRDRATSELWSGLGFKAGDKVTINDSIYAMMLASDNIAARMLAEHIAGSEANFVQLMNEKATEMGLSQKTTLFQNCTGMHHQYHYTTCNDMAVIMDYAMKNTFCAEVLTTRYRYLSSASVMSDGTSGFANRFLETNIDDGPSLKKLTIQPSTAKIIAGKTGLTEQNTSGSCLVSYAKGNDGKMYIVVTSKASDGYNAIEDHLYLYNTYVK